MRADTRVKRAGLGLVEVVVIVAIVGLLVLILLASLPRKREAARASACRDNLRWIGESLGTYHEFRRSWPGVPRLGPWKAPTRPGPLGAMLGTLGVDDFRPRPDGKVIRRPPGESPPARPVPGFTCPSDPGASSGSFEGPVSYRAVTGDAPDGGNGLFSPGRNRTLGEVESGDGLGFTAAFTERLLGRSPAGPDAVGSYAVVEGTIPASGAVPVSNADAWKADAGSSWDVADWRSSLINHVLRPGGGPSLIAADGQTARMAASSGHGPFVHVLMLDGSVPSYSYRTDPKIWKGLANIHDQESAPRP